MSEKDLLYAPVTVRISMVSDTPSSETKMSFSDPDIFGVLLFLFLVLEKVSSFGNAPHLALFRCDFQARVELLPNWRCLRESGRMRDEARECVRFLPVSVQ